MASAVFGFMRAIMASTIPVRGAPLSPSKNKIFQPLDLHHEANASLLAFSLLLALYVGLRRVAQAFLAAWLLEFGMVSGDVRVWFSSHVTFFFGYVSLTNPHISRLAQLSDLHRM
jgi:hypothetical protein